MLNYQRVSHTIAILLSFFWPFGFCAETIPNLTRNCWLHRVDLFLLSFHWLVEQKEGPNHHRSAKLCSDLQPNRPPKHFSKWHHECDLAQKSTIPTPRRPLYHIYIYIIYVYIYIIIYICVCVSVYNPIQIVFFFSQLARSWPPERMRHRRWGNKRVNDRFFFSPPKKKKNWRIVNMISNCHV